MEMLGNFELVGRLSSQDSGCSQWGYGFRDGQEFFVKQFLSPKFPHEDTVSSPQRVERKKRECALFEQKKRALYQVINQHSDGNAVRIREFFRVDSQYYIATQKIPSLGWRVTDVASLELAQRHRLCAIIAHSIACLHDGGVVHADLKHDNILFTHTPSGTVTAKVIDFDSSFLESQPPEAGEEIVGDQVYFSPEACMSIMGEKVPLTCKMDVFALGVLFHQYITGQLPDFESDIFSCPGEAAANGGDVCVIEGVEPGYAGLLQSMLHPDPQCRPTSWQVFEALTQDAREHAQRRTVREALPAAPQGNPFFRPGDL